MAGRNDMKSCGCIQGVSKKDLDGKPKKNHRSRGSGFEGGGTPFSRCKCVLYSCTIWWKSVLQVLLKHHRCHRSGGINPSFGMGSLRVIHNLHKLFDQCRGFINFQMTQSVDVK